MRYTIGYKGLIRGKNKNIFEGYYVFREDKEACLLEFSTEANKKLNAKYIPVMDSHTLAECYARALREEINACTGDTNTKCSVFVLKLDTPDSRIKIKKEGGLPCFTVLSEKNYLTAIQKKFMK